MTENDLEAEKQRWLRYGAIAAEMGMKDLIEWWAQLSPRQRAEISEAKLLELEAVAKNVERQRGAS